MQTELNQQHDTHITNDQSGWSDTSHYIASLSHEPDFIAYVEKQHIYDRYSIEYADAFAQYTENALSQQEEFTDEKTAVQIRLLANAPYVVRASEAINAYNEKRKTGNRLSRNEWNHYTQLKEQAVWYNQMLSGYMHTNESESFSTILQAISDQAIDHSKDVQQAAHLANATVRGARTEAATRHLLKSAAIPFREATIREDMQGADVVLLLPNGEFHVDIKKSLDELAATSNGYDFAISGEMFVIRESRDKRKKLLFFPGFTDSDLGDNLKLDEKITNERKDIIAAQLMRAAMKLSS